MDMTFTTSVMAADGTTETGTCTLGDMATWITGSTRTLSPAEPDPIYQCDGGRGGGHQYHHRDPRAGKEAERVCRIR